MRKFLLKLATVFACIIFVFAFSACEQEHVHDYTQQITAHSCTEQGYITYTCVCGDSYVDIYATPLGHRYEEEVVAPTCTEQGYTAYTCVCGKTYVDTYVSALGHKFENYISDNNATYTKDGTKTAVCERENCTVKQTITDTNSRILEKVLILDASASMQAQYDDETRFERAVGFIYNTIEEIVEENGAVSLIFADDNPRFIVKRITADSLEDCLETIEGLECSYASANMKGALALAETITKENPDAEIILYTGTDYTETDGITLVDVSLVGEWNAAILDVQSSLIDNYYMFAIDVAVYGRDKNVAVRVEIDGANYEWSTLIYEFTLACMNNQTYTLNLLYNDSYNESSFSQENKVYYLMEDCIYSYSNIMVSITENDSLGFDNIFYLYGGEKPEINIQYASDNPNRHYCVSDSLMLMKYESNNLWDISLTETRQGDEPYVQGYDFYIFENIAPKNMPMDGVVFLINPTSAGYGIVTGQILNGRFPLNLDKSHEIAKNIGVNNVMISSYTRLKACDSTFTPIAWCGTDPVLLVKDTPQEKMVVLLLDISTLGKEINAEDVDSGLIKNKLIYNIFNYFFKPTVEKPVFEAGEKIILNARGESLELNGTQYTQFPATFVPVTPGTYYLSQKLLSGIETLEMIFVRTPKRESNVLRTEILPRPNKIIVDLTVSAEEESRIVKFEPSKQRIDIEKKTTFKLFLENSTSGLAIIKIYVNGVLESILETELKQGSQMIELDCVLYDYGSHVLTFAIVKDGKVLTDRVDFSCEITLDKMEKILIVERSLDEARALINLLDRNKDYEISVINVESNNIPLTLEALCVYDQIILVNIANEDMPYEFFTSLQSYVRDFGGSLFTVGGNKETNNGEDVANAYNREDMYGTLYQEMLPVQAINYTPPIAVMIIIDDSGSMGVMDTVTGRSRLELAQDGAIASLYALTERDYCGVMTLNNAGIENSTLYPMTQMSQIIATIDNIEAGGGTVFSTAIERAGIALRALQGVAKKHIILVTDGEPSDSFEEYVQIIADNNAEAGITMSILGIDLTYSAEQKMQVAASAYGNGRFYSVRNTSMLPVIMREELSMPELKGINHTLFTPTSSADFFTLTGIDQEDIPQLEGFYGTRLKNGASALLTGPYGVPIYAQWNYGKGTVGSFMCDLNGTWSNYWLNDKTDITSIMIASAFSSSNAYIENKFEYKQAPHIRVSVNAQVLGNEKIEIVLLREDGTIVSKLEINTEEDLEKISLYVSTTGIYTLRVIVKDFDYNILRQEDTRVSITA